MFVITDDKDMFDVVSLTELILELPLDIGLDNVFAVGDRICVDVLDVFTVLLTIGVTIDGSAFCETIAEYGRPDTAVVVVVAVVIVIDVVIVDVVGYAK
jgi:hypothetical protein